jgi:predicted glycosyltransferase
MFFSPAVTLLRESDHELLCTSRNYREAVQLAKIKNLELKIVGRHGGPERYEKMRESANRILELAALINKFEPDFAITFSSPEGSRVAFGLGIRHIGFNDSPHAEAVSKLTIPLTEHLFSPWIIPISAWLKFGISRTKITQYRALDPVAWINRDLSRTSTSSPGVRKLKLDRHKKIVLIRPEETKASYIADKMLANSTSMVDALVNSLRDSTNIVILCRYEEQIQQFTDRYEGSAFIMRDVVDGISLITASEVFIGAGGTMTCEASLLGKPTISISPIRFYVEKYLVTSGLVKRASNPMELVRLTKMMLSNENYRTKQRRLAASILDKMEDPIDKLLSYLKMSTQHSKGGIKY